MKECNEGKRRPVERGDGRQWDGWWLWLTSKYGTKNQKEVCEVFELPCLNGRGLQAGGRARAGWLAMMNWPDEAPKLHTAVTAARYVVVRVCRYIVRTNGGNVHTYIPS